MSVLEIKDADFELNIAPNVRSVSFNDPRVAEFLKIVASVRSVLDVATITYTRTGENTANFMVTVAGGPRQVEINADFSTGDPLDPVYSFSDITGLWRSKELVTVFSTLLVACYDLRRTHDILFLEWFKV